MIGRLYFTAFPCHTQLSYFKEDSHLAFNVTILLCVILTNIANLNEIVMKQTVWPGNTTVTNYILANGLREEPPNTDKNNDTINMA